MIHICWHCMLVWNHWSHVIYNEYVLASKLDAWVDAHTRLSMFFIHMWLTHFIRTVPLYTYIYRTHLISTTYSHAHNEMYSAYKLRHTHAFYCTFTSTTLNQRTNVAIFCIRLFDISQLHACKRHNCCGNAYTTV
jgi:hypothetical protein